MSDFSLNSSFDMNRELLLEKRRAQDAERRMFGTSILAELDGDKVQLSNSATQKTNVVTQPQKKDAISSAEATVTTSKDEFDDGKISFKEKVKNFGKGIVAPIKNIFSSPKNIAITALSALACAAIIGVTGGAAAPVFVAAGLIGGGAQIIKGIQQQSKATTDAQAANAWQNMGSGTFTVGVSALSAKASLKANGTDVSGMSTLKAAGKCIADVPKNISTGVKTAKLNVSNFVNSVKNPTVKPTTKPQPKNVTEPKSDVTPETVEPVVTENPSAKPVKVEKPVVETPEVVDVKPVKVDTPAVDVPEEVVTGSFKGDGTFVDAPEETIVPAHTATVNEQQLLPAAQEKPMLSAPKERLLLNAPEERPLLEAPKAKVVDGVETASAATATSSAKATKTSPKTKPHKKSHKHTQKDGASKKSFWEKFKDFFRVFGFFKDKSILN